MSEIPRMSEEHIRVAVAAFESLLRDDPDRWQEVMGFPKEERANVMATAAAIDDLMRLSLGVPMRLDPALLAELARVQREN